VDGLLHSLIFYTLALIVLGSAAVTAFTSNLVHAAFSLLFTFFGVAGFYLLLGADFVGVSQVLVYVGGILVLLLFGVLFTGNIAQNPIRPTINFKSGLAVLILFFLLLIPVVLTTQWNSGSAQDKTLESTVEPIGNLLLQEYLLPFEIASLLLLIALIGAVVVARGEPKNEPPINEEPTS
jgi:NADH-quinone oxidoreductase subunit J